MILKPVHKLHNTISSQECQRFGIPVFHAYLIHSSRLPEKSPIVIDHRRALSNSLSLSHLASDQPIEALDVKGGVPSYDDGHNLAYFSLVVGEKCLGYERKRASDTMSCYRRSIVCKAMQDKQVESKLQNYRTIH